MTEIWIDMAEEHFLAGRYPQAYYTAKLATQLDPFFPRINHYRTAFLIHAIAQYCTNNKRQEPHWYKILQLPNSASLDSIRRSFHRVVKLVHPEDHPSAAAKGAYKLAKQALGVLGDGAKRKAFDSRIGTSTSGTPPPESESPTRDFLTELLMETAEEDFLAGRFTDAYETAKLAKEQDPFNASVDRYRAAFRVHVVARHYTREGAEPNWYQILEITPHASLDSLTHAFCRVGKLVDPERNASAAAEGAYKLVAKAFEVLGNDAMREAFDLRRMMSVPTRLPEKSREPAGRHTDGRRFSSATSRVVSARSGHRSRRTYGPSDHHHHVRILA